MGSWFRAQSPNDAIRYILECLVTGPRDSVFWSVIEHYDLKAKSGPDMAKQVYEHLMDFDLSAPDETERGDS